MSSAPTHVSPAAQAAAPPAPAPKKVKAKAGQYVCEFAAQEGFLDCTEIRNANPLFATKAVLEDGDELTIPDKKTKDTSDQDKALVKAVRVQYPPATLRFLGMGTPMNNPGFAGLTRIGISNYRTDKASASGTGTEYDFYNQQGADDDASRVTPETETYPDPDHFRVEVHDVSAGKKGLAEVTVELQVLQPLYKRDKDAAGKDVIVRDETSRPDPDVPAGYKIPASADRKASILCQRVQSTNYYRSKYLRLVTHKEDTIAGQTLYVGDYFDDGASEDEKRYTEILEQKVRARYTPQMCNPAKCRTQVLADVGEMKAEVRLVVHVMDDACSYDDVRRVVYKQVRRTYASASVRPYLFHVYKHPPIENAIRIGSARGSALPPSGVSGLLARIGAAISPAKVTVNIEGQTLERVLKAGDTVAGLAAALAGQLTSAGFFCKELKDPYPPDAGLEAARLILVFKDADLTQQAKITSATSTDTRLSVANERISSADLGAFTQDENSLRHRILKACCDTKRFDMIVLKSFDTSDGDILYGIATWIHKEFGPCAIVQSDRVTPAVDNRYTFSHEMGHVLMHGGHFTDSARQEQLMLQGGNVVGDAQNMPGRRRISDAPMQMEWQAFDDAAGTWTGPSTLKQGDPHGTLVSRIHTFVKGDAFGAPTPKRLIGSDW